MARIAIVDLVFHWPPLGGSMVIVREIARRLAPNHEIRMFVPHMEWNYPRGRITEPPGFQVVTIPCRVRKFFAYHFSRQLYQKIESFAPDLVWVCDGWALKPFIIKSLAEYRPWHSFFAYEMLCPANGTRFRRGRACGNSILKNPIACNLEVLFRLGLDLRHRELSGVSHDCLLSFAFLPTYRRLVRKALESCRRHLVYGPHYADILHEVSLTLTVVPAGVDVNRFSPGTGKGRDILMAGRVDDPTKGLHVAASAARLLRSNGLTVDLKVTGCGSYGHGIHSVGWAPSSRMPQLYRDAAVVVIPSLWEEPFGLVAVEAMACGVPVVASRLGGLASIVEDGETGFLVTPGDERELAQRLEALLTDPVLRKRMGTAGRRRAVEVFDWDNIVRDYYLPLIEQDTANLG